MGEHSDLDNDELSALIKPGKGGFGAIRAPTKEDIRAAIELDLNEQIYRFLIYILWDIYPTIPLKRYIYKRI